MLIIVYSCFYAVNALLIQHGLAAKTHSGVKVLFAQHFIKTGKMPVSAGDLFALLFDSRQESDYQDFVEISEEFAFELIPKVSEFLALAEELIGK